MATRACCRWLFCWCMERSSKRRNAWRRLKLVDNISVRQTTHRDGPLVCALLSASYPDLMSQGYEGAILEALLPTITKANPALLSSGTYYLAESNDGTGAGCGGWTRERPGSGEIVSGLAHIRHFATHPDWVGRGIGRAIYAVCQEKARSAGVRQFECYATLNAEGFYAALGFAKLKPVDVAVGPGLVLSSILMTRSI